MRATGFRLSDLIQTMLRHGNMDYRVKFQDDDGKLSDLKISSGTDFPAQVILRKAPTAEALRKEVRDQLKSLQPRKRKERVLVSNRGKVLKLGNRIGLGEIVELSRSKLRLQFESSTRWYSLKHFGLRFETQEAK